MMRSDLSLPQWLNVSRETLDRLLFYCDLVEKWNPVINLVSRSGMSSLWNRHILDSAQIFLHTPLKADLWCDVGSGGGFPGIVLAILAKEHRPETSFILVESDRRKAVFLSQASRQLEINAMVKAQRIEDLPPQNANVMTARALAPLHTLCGYAHRHLDAQGTALFAKGSTAMNEVDEARAKWRFDCVASQSYTDPSAQILILKDIQNA